VTTITKPVTRRTRESYSVLFTKARPVVVTISPGDVLEFREHGRRGRWLLAVDTAFKYAVRLQAMRDAAEKAKAKKLKRGGVL
jgi:hypothetical protein